MRADSFKIFITKILALPIWIKQIIHYQIRADLKRTFKNQPVDVDPMYLFQSYRPRITYNGKVELEQRNKNHEEMLYTFLNAVKEEKSIVDIALDCFLTLAEVAKVYITAVNNEYITPPMSKIVHAQAEFYAGTIKTGELLLKIGRISVDQLDTAIRRQIQLKEQGKHIFMAEVIAELGYIDKDAIISMLIAKEEAKKRLIFNVQLNAQEDANADVITLKKHIEKLTYENNYLKTKLKAILKISK